MNKYKIIYLTIFVLFMFAGCSQQEPASNSKDAILDSANLPDSELFTASIRLLNRGEVTTKIDAEIIRKFQKIDSTMAYVVEVDIYDSTGQATTHIIGDSALIREESSRIDIYGHVVLVADDSIHLETEYLYWTAVSSQIKTDAYVKITMGNDVMTGYGMEADQDLFPFRILSQVAGEITDVKKKTDQ